MSDNNKNCYSCESCNSCNYCESCNSCYYCYSCESCNSCNYCESCNSCYSCESCNSCNYCESCYYSSGLRMSEKMIFCLGEGRWTYKGIGYQQNLMVFNKKVTEDEYKSILSDLRENEIKIQLTKWTQYKYLDKDEQTTTAKQMDGLLKVYGYQEAWANFWNEATKAQKDCILNVKGFDSEIFKGITGIDVSVIDDKMQEAMELLKSNGYKIVKD